MKQLCYIFTVTFWLQSCNNHKTQNKTDTKGVKTQNVSTVKQKKRNFIKNESLYDPIFVNEIFEYNEPIKLIKVSEEIFVRKRKLNFKNVSFFSKL